MGSNFGTNTRRAGSARIAIAINAGLGKLPFDPVRDFAPVIMLASAPMLLVVHPGVNARSAAELVALARANPGKLNFSNPGNGTPQHLAEKLFNCMAGIEIAHVVYKGGWPGLARSGGRHHPGGGAHDGVGQTLPAKRQAARAGGGHRETLAGDA